MRTRSWLTALLLLACPSVLTGCGTATGRTTGTTATGGPKPSAAPALPASYRFVLTASCGERTLHGDYRLTVHDGTVTAAKPLSSSDLGIPLEAYPTLAGLLAKAHDAGVEAVVHLERDEAGIPVELSIDHLPDAIDDEECYQVSGLRVLRAGSATR
jgi:hypothetical protein